MDEDTFLESVLLKNFPWHYLSLFSCLLHQWLLMANLWPLPIQSLASFVPMVSNGSLIDDHFSHVEQFMLGDIPFDTAMLKSVRLSFAKIT